MFIGSFLILVYEMKVRKFPRNQKMTAQSELSKPGC